MQPADYENYLSNIFEAKTRFDVRLYAYCLMTNHVHLIVTPAGNPESISEFMRVLAARQTRYINRLEKRTGTLWDSRFKASLIDTDEYLLACCRYVDLNPVRAAVVPSPEKYRWSGYRGRIGLADDGLLDPFSTYESLAASDRERARAYRSFVAQGIPKKQLALIRAAIQRNQLTGNKRFQSEIARRTGRRIPDRGRGRPVSSDK